MQISVPHFGAMPERSVEMSSVYCIYFIIQNVFIFCLLIHIPESSIVRYFYDWIWGFSVRGFPLASSMNEKDITTQFHIQAFNQS